MTAAEIVTVSAGVVGVFAGAGSAWYWLTSARLETPPPLAYPSRPPDWVLERLAEIGRRNRIAAALAGVAIACQTVAFAVPLLWPSPSACAVESCSVQTPRR